MDGKQLKNSILQWAIQGKLVEQNPKDEPAQKLLERIAASRNESSLSLPKGTAKGTKSKDPGRKKSAQSSRIYRENGVWYEQVGTATPKDISDEIPFEIPENWAWCRLKDVVKQISAGGDKPEKCVKTPTEECNIPIYSNGETNEGLYGYTNVARIFEPSLTVSGRGTIGYTCVRRTPYVPIVRLITIIPTEIVTLEYLQKALSVLIVQAAGIGTSIPQLTVPMLAPQLFPLPPLAEQKRIVAKLEQVLPLAEEYGVAQEQLDKLNKELPEALKKSILQEAIQGKLVPQNPKDEPAQKLLERIAASRNESSLSLPKGTLSTSLRGAKATKQSKNPPSRIYRENGVWYEQIGTATPKDITDEIPFEIPENWVWCRLDNLGTFVRGNGIKRDETVSTGKPCVRYGEMYTTYRVKFSDIKSHTTSNIFDKCQKFHKDDILMALTGENKWDIALAAVYQGGEEVALGGDMCRFSPFESNSLYLVYLINSPYGIGYKRETSTGDIIVHTSVGKLGNFLVPLPPLAEQKRIVTKLEQLFKAL